MCLLEKVISGNCLRLEIKGNPGHFYDLVQGTLMSIYNNNRQAIKHLKENPNFDKMPFGRTEVNEFIITMSGSPIPTGRINMSYFRGGRKGQSLDSVDYPANSTFALTGGKTTHMSFTLAFNTDYIKKYKAQIGGLAKEDLLEFQRDMIETEKNLFLNRLKELRDLYSNG